MTMHLGYVLQPEVQYSLNILGYEDGLWAPQISTGIS